MEKEMPAPRALRVFVVDDECLIATTITLILQRNGFEASCYTDPRSALEAADALAPDLLISDMVMPELTGVELAMLMMKRHPACRVVLLSGIPATADARRQAKSTGLGFLLLSKPIPPSDLLAHIQTLCEHPPARLPNSGDHGRVYPDLAQMPYLAA